MTTALDVAGLAGLWIGFPLGVVVAFLVVGFAALGWMRSAASALLASVIFFGLSTLGLCMYAGLSFYLTLFIIGSFMIGAYFYGMSNAFGNKALFGTVAAFLAAASGGIMLAAELTVATNGLNGVLTTAAFVVYLLAGGAVAIGIAAPNREEIFTGLKSGSIVIPDRLKTMKLQILLAGIAFILLFPFFLIQIISPTEANVWTELAKIQITYVWFAIGVTALNIVLLMAICMLFEFNMESFAFLKEMEEKCSTKLSKKKGSKQNKEDPTGDGMRHRSKYSD